MGLNEFTRFVFEQDEKAIESLLDNLKIKDTKDDELCWVANCIQFFCLLLTSKILNEATNCESPLFNMVQIMNSDIIKYRLNVLLQKDNLVLKKLDNLLNRINPERSYDFKMNQGIPIQILNTTPPETVIRNFLDTYISHDNTIIA